MSLVAVQTLVHSGSMIYFYKGTLSNLAKTKKNNFMESTVFHCLGRTFFKKYPLSLNYSSNQHVVHPKSPENFVAQATKTMNSSCTTAVLRYKAMELHAMLSHGVAWLLKRWQTYCTKTTLPKNNSSPLKNLMLRGRSFPVGETVYFQGLC